MARAAAALKRGKPLYTLLSVICRRKTPVNCAVINGNQDGVIKSGRPLVNLSSGEYDEKPILGKESTGSSKASRAHLEFADLVTGGQLEVQILECPSKEELKQKLETLHPEFVSFHGERIAGKDDIGALVFGDVRGSSADDIASLFGLKLPELVYLETSGAEKLGQALHSKGIRHVIYWKSTFTHQLALHFRQGLVAVLQSSGAGAWDTFHVGKACLQVYCAQSKLDSLHVAKNGGPVLIGDAPPKVELPQWEVSSDGEGSKASASAMSAIQIFDEEIEVRLLVCTELSKPAAGWLDAMEAGLSSLLTIEARGLRLLNRISAPPPPMAAALFARGVVTMRCDICTASFARVPLLVSGSAQLCFDDQQLESSIKKELVERSRVVRLVKSIDDRKSSLLPVELRRSVSVACGAPIMELRIATPAWAGQVLRQLSAESSYRSLVSLGIAGVEGAPVAAFQKEDAVRLASSRLDQAREADTAVGLGPKSIPPWLTQPLASRKRHKLFHYNNQFSSDSFSDEDRNPSMKSANGDDSSSENNTSVGATSNTKSDTRHLSGRLGKLDPSLLETMKPIPHTARRSAMPFAAVLATAHAGWSKLNMPNGASGKLCRPLTGSIPGLSLGPLPSTISNHVPIITPSPLLLAANAPLVKPHGCNRQQIEECPEDEFLQDLMQFLVARGHGRLIPPAGAEAFPEVVLNGKRLDLYNLYREVVSRGGFHVGNGINWKGQVFAKMRNHTMTNKMTGVGNTLKKHYETYLLEYELAHNDVDGECCILCHSGAAGDWVNCGICGEWAHFGCDRRTGLGTFKEYAKTDGLEYICPNCKTNGRGSKTRKRTSSDGSPTAAAEPVIKGVPRRTSR